MEEVAFFQQEERRPMHLLAVNLLRVVVLVVVVVVGIASQPRRQQQTAKVLCESNITACLRDEVEQYFQCKCLNRCQVCSAVVSSASFLPTETFLCALSMFSLRPCGFPPRVLTSCRSFGSLLTPNDLPSGLSREWLICGESTSKPATGANRLHMSSRVTIT